jgi:hypothetical protein
MRKTLLAVAVVALAGPAAAQSFTARYEMFVGGLRISELQAEIDIGAEGYRILLELESRGIVGAIVALRSELLAEGRVEDGRLHVERYRADTVRRGSERTVQMTFGEDGRVEELEITPDPGREPIPEELRRGPDPVTALIEAFRQGPHGPHESTSFGGIRAASLSIACDGYRTVTVPGGVDLPERALRCTLDGEQVAGPPPRIAAAFDIERIGTAYLAPHADGHVPVRLESTTSLGRMIARITSFEAAE